MKLQLPIYYKTEKKILNSYIREVDANTSKFALTAINEGYYLGNWKKINKDYNRKESDLQKEKFQQRILDKLNVKYVRK